MALMSDYSDWGADVILLPKAVGTNIDETIFTGVPMNIYLMDRKRDKVLAGEGC